MEYGSVKVFKEYYNHKLSQKQLLPPSELRIQCIGGQNPPPNNKKIKEDHVYKRRAESSPSTLNSPRVALFTSIPHPPLPPPPQPDLSPPHQVSTWHERNTSQGRGAGCWGVQPCSIQKYALPSSELLFWIEAMVALPMKYLPRINRVGKLKDKIIKRGVYC